MKHQHEELVVATMGHRFPDASVEQQALRDTGINTLYLGGLGKEDALKRAQGADAILLGVNFSLDADALTSLSRCRAVVRYGVGVDNIDLEAARSQGIAVSNVIDYCVEEVATHTLALLLLFARRLDAWPPAVRSGQWGSALPKVQIKRLSQSTLGVIGAGRIGKAVIARALPLWGQILASDPGVPPRDIQELGATPASLEHLLGSSDFITLHVPSTAQTKHLLSAARLDLIKPGAVLVNCSRGDIVDEEALGQRLKTGALLGAGLDVFSVEPPSRDGIASLPNVWPTPHVAWLSTESLRDLRRFAAQEAARILLGSSPQNPIVMPNNPAPSEASH